MNRNVIKFNNVQWNQLNEFARQKQLSTDDKLFRVVELAPGFHEENWCTRGYIGYVIEGTLDFQFPDERIESFSAGDGLIVPPGTKHRTLKTRDKVKLFLVEETFI